MAGIYIHIPFCKKACSYCDFHFSTQNSYQQEMVAALCKEIHFRKNELKKITTIYFGGGTPSLLHSDQINQILDEIKRSFEVAKGAEITLEANPDDLSSNKLDEIKANGINRLSIGIQTFQDHHLKWMNRAHSSAQSFSVIQQAQEQGFKNISCDFIFGLPGQTMADLEKDMEAFLRLGVPHISLYNLTIENGTALQKWIQKKQIKAPDEGLASEMFIRLRSVLKEKGYTGYEVSNFSQPGFESKHNSSYWKGMNYIGIGPSAHSYNGKSRRWNISNNSLYIKGIQQNKNYFETEQLSNENQLNEYILTRLRTIWGIDKKEIDAIVTGSFDHCLKKLSSYPNTFMATSDTIVLNEDGMLIADRISSDLFVC